MNPVLRQSQREGYRTVEWLPTVQQTKSECLKQQLTSSKQSCAYLSKQSCLLSALIPHARPLQPSSSRQMSRWCQGPWRLWVVDLQLPLCLPVCSSHQGFDSKADMTGAAPLGFNLRQLQLRCQTATSSHDNSNNCMNSMMLPQWQTQLIYEAPDCLCLTWHNVGEWSTAVRFNCSALFWPGNQSTVHLSVSQSCPCCQYTKDTVVEF